MHSHHVHFIECLSAVWAFSHAIGDSVLDTMVAEKMTACL